MVCLLYACSPLFQTKPFVISQIVLRYPMNDILLRHCSPLQSPHHSTHCKYAVNSGFLSRNNIVDLKFFAEDTEYFLLFCSSFREQRCSLLAGVSDILESCGCSEGAHINFLQLLQYGNKHLPLEANEIILDLTIDYISET